MLLRLLVTNLKNTWRLLEGCLYDAVDCWLMLDDHESWNKFELLEWANKEVDEH